MSRIQQVEKIFSKSDLMLTSHSILRDRYAFYAVTLDILIVGVSIVLNALVFIDMSKIDAIFKTNIESNYILGIVTLLLFFFSIVTLLVNWKGKSEGHRKSCDFYNTVKREAGYLKSLDRDIEEHEFNSLNNIYNNSSELTVVIPENKFLSLKKRHKIKIEISKHLDTNPGALIWLLEIKLLFKKSL